MRSAAALLAALLLAGCGGGGSDDSARIRALIAEVAAEEHPGGELHVTSIAIDGDRATVKFTITENGQTRADQQAVVRRDGTWTARCSRPATSSPRRRCAAAWSTWSPASPAPTPTSGARCRRRSRPPRWCAPGRTPIAVRGISDSGNVFSAVKTAAGTIKRRCSTPGTGGCPANGSW